MFVSNPFKFAAVLYDQAYSVGSYLTSYWKAPDTDDCNNHSQVGVVENFVAQPLDGKNPHSQLLTEEEGIQVSPMKRSLSEGALTINNEENEQYQSAKNNKLDDISDQINTTVGYYFYHSACYVQGKLSDMYNWGAGSVPQVVHGGENALGVSNRDKLQKVTPDAFRWEEDAYETV